MSILNSNKVAPIDAGLMFMFPDMGFPFLGLQLSFSSIILEIMPKLVASVSDHVEVVYWWSFSASESYIRHCWCLLLSDPLVAIVLVLGSPFVILIGKISSKFVLLFVSCSVHWFTFRYCNPLPVVFIDISSKFGGSIYRLSMFILLKMYERIVSVSLSSKWHITTQFLVK